MNQPPRVAFFPDSYNEVDGVANTARHFVQHAQLHSLPMLVVHGGFQTRSWTEHTVTGMELKRGRPSFRIDEKHDFDLWFWRHWNTVEAALKKFRPDIIHITGPSDAGLMGALFAYKMGVPMAASWHTNLHEYAAQRAEPLLRILPEKMLATLLRWIEAGSLNILLLFYKAAGQLFAPNAELIRLLGQGTGKPCSLMGRGVDLDLFSPNRRQSDAKPFTFGYVGRITVEKNVQILPRLEKALLDAGHQNFRFVIVGQGAASEHLHMTMRQAEFTGVLHGEALASAYANMDAFVFPSETDTFGNVVLEALASGVPAIVSNSGGPRFIVQDGVTGFVARDEAAFAQHMISLLTDAELRRKMRTAALTFANTTSWDAVFNDVYRAYGRMLIERHSQQVHASSGPNISGKTPSVKQPHRA